MPTFNLVAHPDHPARGINAVSVDVFSFPGGHLDLEFDVHGRAAGGIWNAPQKPAFTDELWRETCFEAFVTAPDWPGYVELNAAPTGLWAAYRFESYRKGMRRLPEADVKVTAFRWSRAVSIRATAILHLLPSETHWQANFSAVIEEKDGTKSYWALAHPSGPPDFHNAACFTARLPAPEWP